MFSFAAINIIVYPLSCFVASALHRIFLAQISLIFVLFGVASEVACAASDKALRDSTSRLPNASVRTNLIWAAAAEPNLGVDFVVGEHWTVGGNFGLKAWPRWMVWDWDTDNDTRWRNFAIVPEVRWWRTVPFEGWFAGADFIYTHFNVGGVHFPFGMYKDVRDHRFQGSYWGGGLFAGYSWWLGRRWRLEAEAGLAGGLAAYDKYDCPHCGTFLGEERKVAVVPKLGLNLAYNILDRQEQERRRHAGSAPVVHDVEVQNLLTPPVAFVVHLRDVVAPETAGDRLSREDAWVTPIEAYRPLGYQTRPGRDSILCVQYRVDSPVLDPAYARNGQTLRRLTGVLDSLSADGRTGELLVSVVGLASIEGKVERNDTLAVRRARAVADYLMAHTALHRHQFELIGKGEAWDWFRAQLEAGGQGLSAEDVQALRDIIAATADPDERERLIRADKRLYSEVENRLLADQRAAGYIRVYYGNLPDAATERINNEVYALIKNKRYRDAVAAVDADPALKARVLADAEALNAYAIACYFTALDGQDVAAEKEALDMIRQAARQGSEAAARNLEGIESYGPARKEYEAWKALLKEEN